MKGGFLRKIVNTENKEGKFEYIYLPQNELNKILTNHFKQQDEILENLFKITTYNNNTWLINLDFINYFYYNFLAGFTIVELLENEPNMKHPKFNENTICNLSLDDETDILLSNYDGLQKIQLLTTNTFFNLFQPKVAKKINNQYITDSMELDKMISKDINAGKSGAKLYFINEKYYTFNNKQLVIKKYNLDNIAILNGNYPSLKKNYLSLDFYIFDEKGHSINTINETDRTHHIKSSYIDNIKKVYGEDFKLFNVYEGFDKINQMIIICENEPKINEMIISTILYNYAIKNNFMTENIVEYFGSFMTSNPYKGLNNPTHINKINIDNCYQIGLCMELITSDLAKFIEILDETYMSDFTNDMKKPEANYSDNTKNIILLLKKIFKEFFSIMYQLKKSELKFSHNDCTINNVFCNYNNIKILDVDKFNIKIGDLDKSSILFKNIKFCSTSGLKTGAAKILSNIDYMTNEYNQGFFDIYFGNKLSSAALIDVEFISYYARSARIPIFLSYDFYVFVMSLSHNSKIFREYTKKILNNNDNNNIIKEILYLLYSIHPIQKQKIYIDPQTKILNEDHKQTINANILILIDNINNEKDDKYSIKNILSSFSKKISSNDHLKYIYNVNLDSIFEILKKYNINNTFNNTFNKTRIPDILYMTTKNNSISNDSKLIISSPLIYKTSQGTAKESIPITNFTNFTKPLEKILKPAIKDPLFNVNSMDQQVETRKSDYRYRIGEIRDENNLYAIRTQDDNYIPSVYFRTNYYTKRHMTFVWTYNYNGYLGDETGISNSYNEYIANINILNKEIKKYNEFTLLPAPALIDGDIYEEISIDELIPYDQEYENIKQELPILSDLPLPYLENISTTNIPEIDSKIFENFELPPPPTNDNKEQEYYMKYLKYKKKYLTLKNKFM
jgi:hypothetical protein